MNYLTAILCGAGLLTAQYFAGRGPYPFLPLPAYAVLCLAALVGGWAIVRRQFAVPRWACVGFALAFALWMAVPLVGEANLWMQGAVLRLVLGGLVVYGLLVFVVTGPRERFLLIGLLLAGAVVQGLFGAFQYLTPNAVPYLGWISELCPHRMEGHAFRARGFYYNANHLAWLLNFAGAFALALGAWGRVGIRTRVALLYGAAMFFSSGIFTQSRGGLLGAAAAVVVFFLVSCRALFHGALGQRGRVFALVSLALLVCLGAAWQAYTSSDLAQIRVLKAGEEDYRMPVWKSALRQWQTSPLTGTGAGTFTNAARFYRFQTMAVDDIYAHNDWVQCLAEFGLIGAGLGLCVALLHVAAGWKAFGNVIRHRMETEASPSSLNAALQLGALASLAAFAVHSFFDFNMQIPANALLPCVSLGILASPGQRCEGRLSVRLAGRTAVTLVAAMGALLGVSSWRCHRAELAWILADKELQAGNFALALERVENGLIANPQHARLLEAGGRAALPLGRGGAEGDDERRALLERAVAFFSAARTLEPRDAWHAINLGYALDSKKDFTSAQESHLQGIAGAPYYATPYEFYGLHLEMAGKTLDAIRVYGLALAFPETTFASERRKALLDSLRR